MTIDYNLMIKYYIRDDNIMQFALFLRLVHTIFEAIRGVVLQGVLRCCR